MPGARVRRRGEEEEEEEDLDIVLRTLYDMYRYGGGAC